MHSLGRVCNEPTVRNHIGVEFCLCANFLHNYAGWTSKFHHRRLYISWDNALAPTKRQAIIWTNDVLFTDAHMRHSVSMGKFNWWVWYVIIFLYVQFWIRLSAVSKRGKKVRTVSFPVVRSVNKSRDTRSCVQNKPEYVICVIFTTRSYYTVLGLILCYLI